MQCDAWMKDASNFLLGVGRKATECRSSADALALIQELDKKRSDGAQDQDGRLQVMEKIATELYGMYEKAALKCTSNSGILADIKEQFSVLKFTFDQNSCKRL